ncbi:MAG: DUF4194 domain-containing protein [Candidatus Enterosoma sp.]|nr:DUF4194 domain-containing protein [Candidatus Enterosoma sp.]
MFENEIEKMTRGERDMFKKVANHLLYTSFITRRTYDKTTKMFKTNQMYIFIEQYYSLFEDYFSFVDIDINKDDQDGVIYTSSISEYNHLRIDVPTTLLVFALRSYYEGEVSKNPSESFILMNNIQVMNLINELGLSNLSKRISSSTVSSSLSYLNSYNILNRFIGSYSDPSYSFYITPAIRYVISSEKMNALYSSITKRDEEDITILDEKRDSTSIFDSKSEEEK